MILESLKESNKMDKEKIQRQKGYGCSTFGQDASTNKNILKIKWQRLIFEGETCPRCGSTEKELDEAISNLRQSLAPLEIEIVLEKEELPVSEFKKDPLQSWKQMIKRLPGQSLKSHRAVASKRLHTGQYQSTSSSIRLNEVGDAGLQFLDLCILRW